MKVYGIKNCSSVKKGLDFLDAHGLKYEFLDIKKLDESTLNAWLKCRTMSEFLNLAGLTAKKIGLNKEKLASLSSESLKKLVLESPTLIKRPVIEENSQIYIGKEYESLA